ncbi:TetR/AcrR family transcriptional regulator [Acetanaerobacterium elongatum]|uniref:Transcriptional regulator, TetR family n=1 Tax=Acetanaerobacterium elongatum TaxID=258515 RepID=A0A1H0GFL8_9FIRM|nr:TetR/AcrR family transcriptional regulator [Acetanaerobacterium elongatum]SDO05700.1 transcriptional regulator, TetR family [Acetanaerobacterium elongatum]
MPQEKNIRNPKQQRSKQTKDRIRSTALELFCKNGYFNTTTNEIAKVAGVSIGSLYSYFKDKDTILIEIMADYSTLFTQVHQKLIKDIEKSKHDKRAWLRTFIEEMVAVHENSKAFNRELQIICYSKPEVAEFSKQQRALSRQTTLEYFRMNLENAKIQDVEAAAIVCFNLISSTVDYIVFEAEEGDSNRDRIIDMTLDAILKLLYT